MTTTENTINQSAETNKMSDWTFALCQLVQQAEFHGEPLTDTMLGHIAETEDHYNLLMNTTLHHENIAFALENDILQLVQVKDVPIDKDTPIADILYGKTHISLLNEVGLALTEYGRYLFVQELQKRNPEPVDLNNPFPNHS